jgi:hypothetical protein
MHPGPVTLVLTFVHLSKGALPQKVLQLQLIHSRAVGGHPYLTPHVLNAVWAQREAGQQKARQGSTSYIVAIKGGDLMGCAAHMAAHSKAGDA